MIFRISDLSADCMVMPLIVWILEKDFDNSGEGGLDDELGQGAEYLPFFGICHSFPSSSPISSSLNPQSQ